MLTQLITGPRAWRASTIDNPRSWYHPLSDRCLAALDQTVQQLRRESRPVTETRAADYPCAACADDLRPALAALEAGRGFVILSGIPRERYSVQELQALYWLVGQLLGRPFEQNVQGTLLYDVRDTGQDVRYGARFSVTNAESTFHTDNSFGAEVLDYVGLLCVNSAKSGGLNQVVSAYSLHNDLLSKHRDILEVLYQPFHIDRRGGVRPGEPPTAQVPIMHWDGRELTCCYLRYWIEVGHEKAGQPLTPIQVKALDVLDGVLRDRDLQVEFGLKPGDMFYINNRWILHNRSAFEDHAEPERKRHYVRLWLKAREEDGQRSAHAAASSGNSA
jgi:alpha-ketoglutarate-dependent taurine dioxygenase